MDAQKHLLRQVFLGEVILIRFFHQKRVYLDDIFENFVLLKKRAFS